MNFVSALNEMSHVWLDQMRNSLIDTTVLLGVVTAVWLLLRKRLSAQVGCCLFLLVLIKAAIPMEIPGPSWLAAFSPREQWQQWVETSPPAPTNHAAPYLVTSQNLQSKETTHIDTVVSAPVLATTTNKDTLPATIAPVATPLAIQTQQKPTLTAAAWLMIVWGSTACGMLTWFAWIHIQFRRQLQSAMRVVDAALLIKLEKLRRTAGVRQTVRYFVTDDISSPAVWGILRPCLLLPSDFSQTYSLKQMQWIMLHEFAHIRHGDLWIALFQRLVQMLHVINPAVWIANGMINRLREYACDDAALLATDASRRDCGGALLRAVEAAQTQPTSLAPALGIFRPGRMFRNRLVRILDTERRVYSRIGYRSALILILLAAIVLPRVRANDEPVNTSAPAAEPAAEKPAQPQPAATAPTEFFAELPNGGTVELVGISEHPSQDGPWWRADGSPLETPPYAKPGGKYNFGGAMIGREFAFRFHGVPKEILRGTIITLIGSGGSRSLSVPEDHAGKPLENMRVKMLSLPRGTKQAKFRISVPNGDWRLVAASDGTGHSAQGMFLDGAPFGLTFLPARTVGNDIRFSFSHNATSHEVRVTAMEIDGKTQHEHSRLRTVGAGGFFQSTAEFSKLKGKHIRSFNIEVRKLTEIWFEQVAAAPGEQTEFKVVGAARGWGSFSGQFLYDGQWPEPKVLVEKGNADVKDAAVSAARTIHSEELIVHKTSRGVKNVFIYLKNPPPEIHPSLVRSVAKKVVFDANGRRFVPHALIAQTNQTILLKNADPIPSNVHIMPGKNSPYSLGLRPRDRSGAAIMFNKPEPAPFPVDSDLHSWMKSHWLILDHPYAAITDRQGKFVINNLPAGKHEFVVWHEKFGWLEKSLTIDVKAGKTVKMAPRKIGLQANHPNSQRPFVAKGRVTDSNGRPLADVKVRANSAGHQAATKTNANGDYELHFGHGPLADEPDFVHSGLIYAMKPSWFESNLCRQGEVLITMSRQNLKLDRTPAQENLFLPLQPKTVNFEMARSAEIRGVVLDANGQPFPKGRYIYLEGPEMPPCSSVAAGTKLDERGAFVFSDVPTNFEWVFTVDARGPEQLRSKPIHLPHSRTYNARLQLDVGKDLSLLELK